MPHIHEKIDFVTGVYIVHKNRVLLRKHDKYKIWLGPGGHIELNEDPNQSAIREAKEEVGLDIKLDGNPTPASGNFGKNDNELIPPRFLHRHRINDTHEHISFIYFATAQTDQFKQGENEISDEIKWFTSAELDDPAFGVSENTKSHAHAALRALGTKS